MSEGKATILVTDDQPGIRRLLAEILRDDGYEVLTASNGYKALEIMKSIYPALIIMDMKMPGLDGIETLRELRRLGRKEAVLLMTAYGEEEEITEAVNLGIVHYITKPFDILAMKKMVADTVATIPAVVVPEQKLAVG